MQIQNVNTRYLNPYFRPTSSPIKEYKENNFNSLYSTQLPLGFNTSYNISFGSWVNPNRLAGDVDIETYHIMTEKTKERYRRLYNGFSTNEEIDQTQLFDKNSKEIPLKSDKVMENFIKASKIYLNYKDQPIICLGRSPKWFLNTAYWMKDGIPDYKFVAFSRYWFYNNPKFGITKIKSDAPTENEEMSYRKYLDRIGASPKDIVEKMRKDGKKTVITDYICSGKGACSFLDLMSRYAQDLGILEEFSKSIQIVGIGSMAYMESLFPPSEDEIDTPSVPMPPLLEPYSDNIKQDFYNIDFEVFEEMLLNQNTNECRSTYYPHNAWDVYNPDTFKTGLITDMSKVDELLDYFKDEKYIITFSAAMQDFRNLLNFRILDYLNSKDMLREYDRFMFKK